ncbi:protein kinase domain-containing protein [Streptomyces sp. SBT349]|uniref:protein kinase domain-containing protein n=1 Tax=Streptomyces sp. SBT349 TaxID=1580539 RepID=UPI00069DB972|nr:transporter substrate-binding domain-containing protein [Streptomyces sp. SBT349]
MEDLRPSDPVSIGAYRLLARLGAGGMGQVFLGRSPSGRMVAVKVVHRELAESPEFRRRFRAEVEAARRVSGPWTAPVLDSDTESVVPWIATGYVVGPPLREVVDALHGPLPEPSAWALAHGLAQALTEIHGSGLIHRDLKPSNVMVTLEGPKVIDFGIARAVDSSMVTRTGSMIGSPGYMPPEQIRGARMSGAADVFALGAVLAFTVTGADPFSADGAQLHTVLYRVMHEEPELGPPDGMLRGELRDLVVRCMAKEPGDRPELDEIAGLAAGRAGDDFWLPPGLTARLGRDAADLLAFDGPGAAGAGPAAGPPPPTAPPTVVPGGQPTMTVASPSGYPSPYAPPPAPLGGFGGPQGRQPYHSGEFGSTVTTVPSPSALPPPAGRGRHVLALVAAMAALAVVVSLIVMTTDGGDDIEAPQAGELDGGTSEGTDGGSGGADPEEAPLAHLLPQEVRDAGGITVHSAPEAPPLVFTDEEGVSPAGFEVDLARELEKLLGVEFRFSLTGEFDLAVEAAVQQGAGVPSHIAMAGYPDLADYREEHGVDFVNHYEDGWALMGTGRLNLGVLGTMCGERLAIREGEQMEDIARSAIGECYEPVEFVAFSSIDEMAAAARAHEVDAALLLYSEAAHYVGEHEDSGLAVDIAHQEKFPRGIAVPSEHDDLRDAIASALKTLMDDGTYEELLERWHIPQAALEEPTVNAGI